MLAADVPISEALARRMNRSAGGREWLAQLPDLIAQRLKAWELEVNLAPGQLPWNGHGAIVLPVRACRPLAAWDSAEQGHDAGLAALKIAFPHAEATVESAALRLWDGNGAVRLLAEDSQSCSMLLERLDGDSSLADVPLDVAAQVWGQLVQQLSLAPDGREEWRVFEHVAARAERLSDELPADWDMLGRPFPRWLLEAALEVCQTRGAVGRRSSQDVLVNQDFHFLNVLPRTSGGNDFVAIDPQPMIGEAEFAVAPLLWNRLAELPASDPEAALRDRCVQFSSAAGLDPEVARQWAVVREVENALDYATKPAHQGDFQRSLWVAGTMAGKQVPGLPHASILPEPGQA